MKQRRSLVRASALVAITALSLTACGSSSSGGDSASALSDVKVTGGDAKTAPTVTLEKKPITVSSTQSKVVTEGKGDAVTKDDTVKINAVILNGKDGKVVDDTWKATPASVDLTAATLFPSIKSQLPGKKIGSRVLVASTPKDAFGEQGNQQAGIAATDPVVFLIDIISTVKALKEATGTAVAPKKDLPTAKVESGKPATITMPKDVKASDKLVSQNLIDGKGAKVTSGQTIRVTYTGAIYNGGKVFDSSADKTPNFVDFPIGVGKVIPGWDKGLVGKTVGSRVLLVVPPGDGYGEAGQPNSTPPIKGTDTLVFVVDILAAY